MAEIYVKAAAGMLFVALQLYQNIDLQTFYKQQCQMSCMDYEIDCMDYEIDKHRTDFWDWRFLRFYLCNLGNIPNCTQSNSFNSISKEIPPPFHDFIQAFMDIEKETDFFEITHSIFVTNNSHSFYVFFYHRRARFLYYDFLDLRIGEPKTKDHTVNLSSSSDDTVDLFSSSDEAEVRKMIIFSVIIAKKQLHTKNLKNNVSLSVANLKNISIGTFVFDQRYIIFTEGSKCYSWWLKCLTILSLVFMFFFIWKFLTSLHGCTETYTYSRFNMENCKLTRPDLIPIGIGNLSIFRSYFYSTVLGAHGCLKGHIGFAVVFIIWFYSVISYNELSLEYFNLDKNLCVILLITCCLLSLLLVPELVPVAVVFLLCFSLIMFTPELLIKINLFVSDWLYLLYLLFLFFSCCFTLAVLFYFPNYLFKLLINRNLVEQLLWPTWPVQVLVYLTRLITPPGLLQKTWMASIIVLSLLGLTLPQYVGTPNLSYDQKYLHMVSYWLFFPVYFMLKTFFDSYKRKYLLVIEAVFTTLFIAYLCNFLLFWLYPSLKMLKEKELVALLILTLVNDIREISREWYQKYDKFLKDVVSYIRKKYICTDNMVQLATRQGDIALAFNHTDSGQCQHHVVNQGRDNGNQFEIKGLLLFVKDSTVNIPSDFFFQIIKIQGGPGAIRCVVSKELISLILGLFPAVFISWLCIVIKLADFEKYDAVVKLVFGVPFINQYKKLFLHRKTPDFDVKDNSEMEREIDKFLQSYRSSCSNDFW